MMSDMNLFCCICGKPFKATVRNAFCNGKGHFSEACCSRTCLDEKQWRETLSIMGNDYHPKPKKDTNARPDQEDPRSE